MPAEASGADSIFAQAPCRADLAGGTLDLWPLYLFHPGAVTLNVALSIFATCRITPRAGAAIHLKSLDTGREDRFPSLAELLRARSYRHPIAAYLVRHFAPEGGFLLETHSESPAGAGISGSSALMIATTAALARLAGRRLGKEQLRVLAQNIEARIIAVPTGCQDYYPALYGGVSAVHLETGGIYREAIPLPLEDVDRRFVLFYTGAPRASGINNWEVFKAHLDGERRVVRNFEQISRIAQQMRTALAARQWQEVARLLRAEWKLRKANYKNISTPLIDQLIEVAIKQGGVAAKACGAGGGGCVVVMVKEGTKEAVAEALRAHGGQVLPFRVARQGLRLRTFGGPFKAAP